jgi:hypothetical protein
MRQEILNLIKQLDEFFGSVHRISHPANERDHTSLTESPYPLGLFCSKGAKVVPQSKQKALLEFELEPELVRGVWGALLDEAEPYSE